MLPLVQKDILIDNPKFDSLYQDLCRNRLQQDGTSKADDKVNHEHDQLQKDLRKARTEAYQREIIRRTLQDIVDRGEALPDELRDLVLLIAATLGGEVAPDDLYVVEEELARLQCYATDIAALLSKRLTQSTAALSAIALAADVSDVDWPDSVASLGSDIASQEVSLRISRSAIADAVQDLQDVHRRMLETSVKVLEQVIHGGVARHSKGKADYLATVADGLSKKLNMQYASLSQQAYTPAILGSLRSTIEALKREHTIVRTNVRDAEEKLTQYQSARGMSSMIKEYAELLAETRQVEDEIVRLKGGM